MTFSNLIDSGLDAALDIIAPRQDLDTTNRDSRIAAAYAAGRISLED